MIWVQVPARALNMKIKTKKFIASSYRYGSRSLVVILGLLVVGAMFAGADPSFKEVLIGAGKAIGAVTAFLAVVMTFCFVEDWTSETLRKREESEITMSAEIKISDYITKDEKAVFSFYREGNLYYKIKDIEFPVPIADAGMATFLAEDKAIMFMRWFRKHVELLNSTSTKKED